MPEGVDGVFESSEAIAIVGKQSIVIATRSEISFILFILHCPPFFLFGFHIDSLSFGANDYRYKIIHPAAAVISFSAF
jgi:hypothetical protein